MQCADLIGDSRVRSVKFVGSTIGGKSVAATCGMHMKRGAFELGGSDPFIVFEDADIDLAVAKAVSGRLHTNGQACNNSKRFLISDKVYDEFAEKLVAKLKDYVKIGDPMESSTTIGPLAMEKQVFTITQ